MFGLEIYSIIILEGTGKDKSIKKASDKAREDAYNKVIQLPYIPENNSLFLTKYIPIIKENKNSHNNNNNFELFDKPYVFNVVLRNNIYYPNDKKFELEGFKKILDNKNFATSSRLICGLGSSSVLETSITLHHIWGVPYIPGSSFKGVCREVVFWKLAETKNINSEEDLNKLQKKFYGELAIDDNEMLKYQLLFGAQDFKGLLLFLDAYPENTNNIFEPDIMNPHYSGYYNDKEGKIAPGDWENPVPIFFLSVKKGVPFKITVLFDEWRWNKIKQEGLVLKRDNREHFIHFDKNKVIKDEIYINSEEIEKLIQTDNLLSKIVKSALEQYGIGAKRSLGYGSFELPDQTK